MKKSDVLKAVEKRLREEPGIVDVLCLDRAFEDDIAKLEKQAEKNKALGGLMPFVNSGVWETLDRDVALAIIIRSSELGLDDIAVKVDIRDQKGQKVGEYINPDRIDKVRKERPDALFLSEDFCLYRDVQIAGEPFFDIAPAPFPVIEDVPGVKDVTSGSISTLCDDLIRERMGCRMQGLWSHLVGFNYSEEVED